jgi:hypothetical protein
VTIDGVSTGNRIYWTPLKIVTTINSSTIAKSHNLQFTIARTKSSQSGVFIGSRLVMATKDVDFSTSIFTSLLAGDCLTTNSALLRNDL